jgi:hypothetical protein
MEPSDWPEIRTFPTRDQEFHRLVLLVFEQGRPLAPEELAVALSATHPDAVVHARDPLASDRPELGPPVWYVFRDRDLRSLLG